MNENKVNDLMQKIRTNFVKYLVFLSVLAFFIRMIASFEMNSATELISHPPKGTDMETYLQFATSVLKGEWNQEFYYQPFYYSVFLPIVFFIFGIGSTGLIIVQSLLGALTVFVLGLTAAKAAGRLIGLLSAFFLTFYQYHILYTPFALIVVLQTFFLVLTFYLVLEAYKKKSLKKWCFAAFIFSFSILTRGNVLLFIPLFWTLIYQNYKKEKKKFFFIIVLFSSIVWLPQLPFSWQNFKMKKQWVGPSTAFESVFLFGNTPESAPGGAFSQNEDHQFWSFQAQSKTARVPVLSQWWKWVKKSPLAYLELKFRCALLFWDKREIPNNIMFSQTGSKSFILSKLPLLNFWTIASLAICGMIYGIKKVRIKRSFFLYYLGILIYFVATVAFYILARFRLPIIPFLCFFAAYFVYHLWTNRYKTKSFFKALIVLLFMISFVGYGFDFYQKNLEIHVMKYARPNGTSVELQRQLKIQDNGPEQFGSWAYQKLSQRIVMIKTFKIPENVNFLKKRFKILLYSQMGDSAVELAVGESLENLSIKNFNLKKGQNFCSIELPKTQYKNNELKLIISILPLKGNCALGFDLQRNYGRSQLFYNKRILNAEIISSLYFLDYVPE